MEVRPGSLNYLFLISNFFILFIFISYYFRNKKWFLKNYIIGKSLQIVGSILIESHFGELGFPYRIFIDTLFVLGIPFEIFGIISYKGDYSKRIVKNFIAVSSSIFFILVIIEYLLQQHWRLIDFVALFFTSYGGIFLLVMKDPSWFRRIIGITFIAYALIHLFRILFEPSPIMPQELDLIQNLPPPKQETLIVFTDLTYFLMIVSGFGFLIILKEQDEIALEELNKEISRENVDLKKIDEEKNKFFSIIAHDLKGPIGAVADLSKVLIEEMDSFDRTEFEKWLKLIRTSLTQTFTLLNNLLYWARSQSGNLVPIPESININELTNGIIHLLNLKAQSKNISIQNNCNEQTHVYADREMLRTVIRNLISNAIKFSYNGGTIRINSKNGKHPVISIADTGIGIDKKEIDKLFDLDSKLSTPGTEGETGSGIGLKLSYEFVKKNNGKMWVRSEAGKGSTFYISLPSTKYSNT